MKASKKNRRIGPWPRLQKIWDIRAACNFIGGGTGSGLLILSAILIVMEQPFQLLILTGVICILLGMFMVFLEIGKPWRSLNVFFHPQTSWMTREGIIIIPLLLSTGFIYLFQDHSLNKIVAGMMGLFAVTFLYCQVRILQAAKGIPAWCHPALKPYIFISGLAEALGVAVILPGTDSQLLLISLALALLIRFILWRNYSQKLHSEKRTEASCKVIDGIFQKVLITHCLALALLISFWFTGSTIVLVISGVLTTSIGWYCKIIIITKAAQTRSFLIPRTPVRGQGTSRLI
ncbi:MAG: phenylacetyl-CoA:acceptor oxidoreductase [Gammaproteobacteria bacterium]|nr:phenylacetyl-CoA:acceptor oxidoreductase [Gammaproteobacteria bacterium]